MLSALNNTLFHPREYSKTFSHELGLNLHINTQFWAQPRGYEHQRFRSPFPSGFSSDPFSKLEEIGSTHSTHDTVNIFWFGYFVSPQIASTKQANIITSMIYWLASIDIGRGKEYLFFLGRSLFFPFPFPILFLYLSSRKSIVIYFKG